MDFKDILRDIKNLKIQGANNIAKSGLRAFYDFAENCKEKNYEKFILKLNEAKDKILSTRPTEPLMRNYIKGIFNGCTKIKDLDEVKKYIKDKVNFLENYIDKNLELISNNGVELIKNGMTILLHCHSSSVIDILLKAKERGINFKVICTESRPKYQGRLTARDLVKNNIDTTQIVDSAVASYMHKIDLILVGADLITYNGDLVNKIGTFQISCLAKFFNKPFYSATLTHKFDPETKLSMEGKIEFRSPKEIWEKPIKGLKIENPAFDLTPSKNITAFVTERGILNPQKLVKLCKDNTKFIGDIFEN